LRNGPCKLIWQAEKKEKIEIGMKRRKIKKENGNEDKLKFVRVENFYFEF
jgi:hypothetical protein